MAKRCVIPDCTPTNDSTSQYFHFPKDLSLQEKWLEKIPLLDFTSLNFEESVICERHFNLKKGTRKLSKKTLPVFPAIEKLYPESCRFCLRKMEGSNLQIDDTIKFHYQNLLQEELSDDFKQTSCCFNCYKAIRNSSLIKNKIQVNQELLKSLIEQNLEKDFVEIKIEPMHFDDLMPDLDFDDFKEEVMKVFEEIPPEPESKKKLIRKRKKVAGEIEEKSSKKTRRVCPKCPGKYFVNLYNHNRQVHEMISSGQCDHCGELFSAILKSKLENHMKRHRKPLSCTLCTNKQFNCERNLRLHIQRHHEKKDLIYCEFCGKSFTDRTPYERHLGSIHTGKRPMKCPEPDCTYACVTNSDLNTHIKRMHNLCPSTCPGCGKIFKSKDNMQTHYRWMHRVRNFVCHYENCGKTFDANSRLQTHIKKRHLGVKNHSCKTCGKSYQQNNQLQRHMVSAHTSIKIPCEVPNCHSFFSWKDTYKCHVLSVHKDLGEENLKELLERIKSMRVPKAEISAVDRKKLS
jgi:hypothetical protein